MTASHARRMGGLFALAALLTVAISPLFAQGAKSDSVVEVKAKAGKPDASGKQEIAVTLTPKKGWYIYANPVGQELFEDNATVVSVVGKTAKVSYPTGVVVKDAAGDYKVYDTPVTVTAVIQGDSSGKPVEVSVKINACSKPVDGKGGRCLQPATVKVVAE
jgi:DsbC/DsbD-like thiol-disulfide interchange protein